MHYKHTQISYVLLVVFLLTAFFFANVYRESLLEPISVNSGPNFAITAAMVLILYLLFSFIFCQIKIDDEYLRIKFGFGIYQKKILRKEIISVEIIKNNWFSAGRSKVKIKMKDGSIFQIGVDDLVLPFWKKFAKIGL